MVRGAYGRPPPGSLTPDIRALRGHAQTTGSGSLLVHPPSAAHGGRSAGSVAASRSSRQARSRQRLLCWLPWALGRARAGPRKVTARRTSRRGGPPTAQVDFFGTPTRLVGVRGGLKRGHPA